jgi:hypothetical protein
MLENLLMTYAVDPVRSGYKVAFRTRDRAPVAALTRDDFLVPQSSDNRMEIPGTLEMPRTVLVGYTDGESGEYGQTNQTATLQTLTSTGTMSIETAVVLTAAEAKALAWRILVTAWVENKLFRRSLPVKFAYLEPGDIVSIPAGLEIINARIQRNVDAGIRRDLELVSVATDGYSQDENGAGRLIVPVLELGGVAVVRPVLINTPPLRSADEGLFLYVAATHVSGASFGGGVLQKSLDQTTWEDVETFETLAPTGTVTTNLSTVYLAEAGVDYTSKINVEMNYGSLTSISESVLRTGRNVAWLPEATLGEYIQFATASLTAPNQYELSTILRDRLNLGYASPHSAGVSFVMMDRGGVKPVKMSKADVGKTVYFRLVSNAQALADAEIVSIVFRGRTVAPRAPTMVSITRTGDPIFGAIGISRWGPASFEWEPRALRNLYWSDGQPLSPIEEPIEKYRVSVPQLSGTPITYEVTAKNYALILSDVTNSSDHSVSVAQYSSYFGGYDESEVLRLDL